MSYIKAYFRARFKLLWNAVAVLFLLLLFGQKQLLSVKNGQCFFSFHTSYVNALFNERGLWKRYLRHPLQYIMRTRKVDNNVSFNICILSWLGPNGMVSYKKYNMPVPRNGNFKWKPIHERISWNYFISVRFNKFPSIGWFCVFTRKKAVFKGHTKKSHFSVCFSCALGNGILVAVYLDITICYIPDQ